MTNHPNQPKQDDAVLGGNAPAYSGLVLGGIEGVKWRLGRSESSGSPASIEQKIAALNDALKYGQAGLDLVIQALEDESWHIHQAAYSLLNSYSANNVKQSLVQYKSRLAQELQKCYEAGERNFPRASLNGLYLPWAVLSEVNFTEANLSEAYLNRAYLIEADLTQADLSKINLTGGDLSEAILNRANLNQAYLNKANLSQATLIEANLRSADLSAANLSETNLSAAKLSWANLSETNLSGANLSGANLVGAKFPGSDLSGVDLRGAKLNGVNLNEANLAGAYYNDETDFPVGFGGYSQLIKL
ncbi:MAG: pentapeptide repeat-containing protein [Cyanobacteriota bacterium]